MAPDMISGKDIVYVVVDELATQTLAEQIAAADKVLVVGCDTGTGDRSSVSIYSGGIFRGCWDLPVMVTVPPLPEPHVAPPVPAGPRRKQRHAAQWKREMNR